MSLNRQCHPAHPCKLTNSDSARIFSTAHLSHLLSVQLPSCHGTALSPAQPWHVNLERQRLGFRCLSLGRTARQSLSYLRQTSGYQAAPSKVPRISVCADGTLLQSGGASRFSGAMSKTL